MATLPSPPDRLLALDLGARFMGWACGVGPNGPLHGLVLLPGTSALGRLYRAVGNSVERLLEELEPTGICYVPKFTTHQETAVRTAEALGGVQAMVDLTAYDYGLPEPRRFKDERAVRKVILGQRDFGLKDPVTGGLIAGSGRSEAKRVVLEWCAVQGYQPLSHDTGDALVLLAYVERLRGSNP